MVVVALMVAGVVIGYAATVHADYLIHRNIWHGRWWIVHRGPLRWLLHRTRPAKYVATASIAFRDLHGWAHALK
jgi:hypothetical protein